MGTWGVGAFENDDAGDWAYELEKSSDLSLVESAFETIESSGDYIAAPDACIALAACEVLARLNGSPGVQTAYTTRIDQWVLSHPIRPSTQLLGRAQAVIGRIMSDESELRELWSDSGESDNWLADVQDLRRRLQNS